MYAFPLLDVTAFWGNDDASSTIRIAKCTWDEIKENKEYTCDAVAYYEGTTFNTTWYFKDAIFSISGEDGSDYIIDDPISELHLEEVHYESIDNCIAYTVDNEIYFLSDFAFANDFDWSTYESMRFDFEDQCEAIIVDADGTTVSISKSDLSISEILSNLEFIDIFREADDPEVMVSVTCNVFILRDNINLEASKKTLGKLIDALRQDYKRFETLYDED